MIPGWRARIHYWSRQGWLLKRLALGIVVSSFLVSLLIIAVTPETGRFGAVDPLENKLRQEWQALNRAEKADPHELIRWLNQVLEEIHHLCNVRDLKTTTWEDYLVDGHLAGYEVQPLLARHSADPALPQLWQDFIQASLTRDTALMQSLGEKAALPSPPITANQILAYQMRESAPPKALAALMREATLFPQSLLIREAALHLAIRLKDIPVLRQIAAQPDWWSAMDARLRRQAAAEMGDFWLLWLGMLEYRSLLDAPLGTLAVALLAAAIWYVILVLHGVRGAWRWVMPLPPLLAGVLSIWPVPIVASWQEIVLGMNESGPFPQDLWYQIGGVGLREELSKLLLASFFMPWLLYKRPPGGALMVGAFVGLGFALEENISYYLRYQGGTATVRFFTANFFHAALTGISTHALYLLLRSRFGTAERFLVSVLGVILAHGCYNYGNSGFVQGLDYLSVMILAVTAWHFLDLVEMECSPGRQWVSPAAVFLIGTALLMALVFLSIAVSTPDRQILAAAAGSSISMFPMAFIYWRRLQV